MIAALIEKVKELLPIAEKDVPLGPTVHRSEDNMWGNHISMWEKQAPGVWKIYGHLTPRPVDGECFAQKMESGKTALFQMTDIDYVHNPNDMFWAIATAKCWECPICKGTDDPSCPDCDGEGVVSE